MYINTVEKLLSHPVII